MIPRSLVPAKYHSIHFKAVTCCRLGLAVYEASLFTANVMLGLMLLARYWSSLMSLAKKLLQFTLLPSGLGMSLILESNSVVTLLILLRPSCSRMDSM